MKKLLGMLLVAASVCGAPAMAAAGDASPLAGTWAVDLARLPMPPQARPKSVKIRFADAGKGQWSTQVDIVYADGEESHATGTAPLDGPATPVKGSAEADLAAVRMPTPDVLVMTLGKGGQPASTRIYAVARDGKTMVETATYFGGDGQPVMRTNYFTRER
ncbi:hypothetical protein [Luteimonas aquatica]|uniref:hypothetical protein n=1 Tax=Luteimonas aquatica TaxID=450364 RepID=UPI001F56B46C|nr:hypothetical protein [Luteimonas aquatica]